MHKAGRRDVLKTIGGAAVGLTAPAVIRSANAAPPFFKLYLMIPNNQPARMIWGTLAAQQMSKLGIDVISSYVDFPTIASRRTKGSGKIHVDGGWDSYLERYYYSSITPLPNSLFMSNLIPPNGPNFYYLSDPEMDKILATYAYTIDPAGRMAAIKAFEKRWYDTEPMTILFYPEDAIAVNPKLTGFSATTFNPVFFPQPENWTIAGSSDATAAFASWPPPTSLIPMYTIGYQESNIFGPVYNCLLEYDSWESKKLVSGLAESIDSSADGKHHVIKLRSGVTWHSGEPFTAKDVKFTWDVIMNKAYASAIQGNAMSVFGSADAYKITGPLEITVDLPQYLDPVPRADPQRCRHHAGTRLQGHQAGSDARARREHLAWHLHGEDIRRRKFHSAWRHRHRPVDSRRLRRLTQGLQVHAQRKVLEEDERQREDLLHRQHQRHRRGAQRAEIRGHRRA